MTFTAFSSANARDWRRYHGHHSSHRGDALVAGVAGLAAGALIAGALSTPRPAYADDGYIYDDGYYDQPRYVRRAPVRVRYTMEPWTREWFRYCSDRYRSFDARTGTFTGYDGQRHFCNAN